MDPERMVEYLISNMLKALPSNCHRNIFDKLGQKDWLRIQQTRLSKLLYRINQYHLEGTIELESRPYDKALYQGKSLMSRETIEIIDKSLNNEEQENKEQLELLRIKKHTKKLTLLETFLSLVVQTTPRLNWRIFIQRVEDDLYETKKDNVVRHRKIFTPKLSSALQPTEKLSSIVWTLQEETCITKKYNRDKIDITINDGDDLSLRFSGCCEIQLPLSTLSRHEPVSEFKSGSVNKLESLERKLPLKYQLHKTIKKKTIKVFQTTWFKIEINYETEETSCMWECELNPNFTNTTYVSLWFLISILLHMVTLKK